MNISNEKRPSDHGQGGTQLIPQTTSQLLLDEVEFDFELTDKFGAWLESRLESLVEQFADFVTPHSLRRDLRRR